MTKKEKESYTEDRKDRIQYIVTLAVTLFALIFIVVYSFGSFYKLAKSDAVEIGARAVSEESEKLNNFLLMGMDVLQVTGLTIDHMMQSGETPEKILAYLLKESAEYTAQIDSSFTGIYGVFNGKYLDGIGWEPEAGYVPEERPWYTAAKKGNGKPVIVPPYLDAQTHSVMISVSQLLSDKKSVVSLDIVMDDMQRIAQGIRLNGPGYGFIIDQSGLIVAHSDEREKGKNYLQDSTVSSERKELIQKILQSNGETIDTEINGKNCRVFSKKVQDDWSVVMVINTEDLLHRVQMNLFRNIILSLLIFIVVLYYCTLSHRNRIKAAHYANELQKSQQTLEARVVEQTNKIKEQTDQIMNLQENVIEGMATLIESRDGNTGEHVRSTKKYVGMIASYMLDHQLHPEEVNEEFVRSLTNAAPLHDVGKIMIADNILNKPGRFTPEEFEVMKTHSKVGAEIVENILAGSGNERLIQLSCDVAHYHHEKWDGSGYPEGLKGNEIPLSARIMAVADVFDALVSKRVYKDAMPLDKAFSILIQDSGKHFDPEIVVIFLNLRKNVEKYLKRSA